MATRNTLITIDIETLAKWLAWSDRAHVLQKPKTFGPQADKYWDEVMSGGYKGHWVQLAATLVGETVETGEDARVTERRNQRAREAEVNARATAVAGDVGDSAE